MSTQLSLIYSEITMLKEICVYGVSAKVAHTKEDSENFNTQVWNFNVLARGCEEARTMVEEYLASGKSSIRIYSVSAIYNNGSNLTLVDTDVILKEKWNFEE